MNIHRLYHSFSTFAICREKGDIEITYRAQENKELELIYRQLTMSDQAYN